MAEQAAPEIGVDQQLVHLLSHEMRVEILVILVERVASPKGLAVELKKKLSDVSYHIKELLKMGYIENVGEEPRRGQVAHLYRAVLRPIWSNEEWGKLDQPERERYVVWLVQLFNLDVAKAWAGGTFQARGDAHASRGLYRVDEQGWRDLNAIQDEALKASERVQEESAERLAQDGGDGIVVRAAMLCFEMPAPEKQQR